MEARAKAEGRQPALFELKTDCPPRFERTADGRYRQPSSLESRGGKREGFLLAKKTRAHSARIDPLYVDKHSFHHATLTARAKAELRRIPACRKAWRTKQERELPEAGTKAASAGQGPAVRKSSTQAVGGDLDKTGSESSKPPTNYILADVAPLN